MPGLTDSEEHMKALKGYIDTIKNVEKVELLPFHQLGREKYKVMGIDYPLEDTEPMEKDVVEKYQKIFFNK